MDTETTAQQGGRNPWPLYGLCAAFLIVCLVGGWNDRAQGQAIAQLRSDLDQLKAVQIAAPKTPPADMPSPDPVPARPNAPRAAVRPTQHPLTAAPAEAASTSWGATDLDREIDDFTRSLNQPEQAK